MFAWFVQNALAAAVLAMLVALACGVTRASPAVRHRLWLVVLVKLVTPALVVWPYSPAELWERYGPRLYAPASSAIATAPTDSASDLDLGLRGGVVGASEAPGAAPEFASTTGSGVPNPGEPNPVSASKGKPGNVQPTPSTAAAHTSNVWTRWRRPLSWLWAIGATAMLLLNLVRIARFQRRLGRASSGPDWLVRATAQLARRMRLRPPALLVVPALESPSIWCLGRATLLWPACLATPDHPERWLGVIAHELAHLKRLDPWVSWLELAAGCLWWWNPLYWYVRRALHDNAELACDAWGVWAVPDGRRAYAEALIDVSRLVSRGRAPVPALAATRGARRRAFERRLTMILCERISHRVPLGGLFGIALIGFAALPNWSLAQVAAPAAGQPAPAAAKPAPSEPVHGLALPVLRSDTAPRGDAPPASTTPSAAEPAQASDRRLEVLEAKLEALISEVRLLRAGAAGMPANTPRVLAPPGAVWPVAPRTLQLPATATRGSGGMMGSPAGNRVGIPSGTPNNARGPAGTSSAGSDVQMLARVTYKVPQAKAEALATFLREQVEGDIETKVDGDSISVTATPPAQAVIGQLVALILGQPPAAVSAGPLMLGSPASGAKTRVEKMQNRGPASSRQTPAAQPAPPLPPAAPAAPASTPPEPSGEAAK